MFIRLSQFGLALCLAAGVATAQNKNVPPPTPKPAPASKPDKSVKVTDKAKVKDPEPPPSPRWNRFDGVTSEKAIAVEPNVDVNFCISDGDVKINGSERNEVRVFVRNGSRFEFRSVDKHEKTGKATWLSVVRSSAETRGPGPTQTCLSGESVEIDMPLRGSLIVEGRSATVTIDSVTKVSLKLIEGDITVRNVPGGLEARTDQGEMVAESIGGVVTLETTDGDILAYDLKSSRPVDPLRIKTTRGTISLQNIWHRRIDVNTVFGSIKYAGSFQGGGVYIFRSGLGRVGLLLPDGVNCKISANYGFGTFDSSYPMKVLTETTSQGGKSLVAALGSGSGPLVEVSTTRGSIRIVKQGELELP